MPYCDFEDLPPEVGSDELSDYLSLPPITDTEQFSILDWWHRHSTQFPTLSKVASFIYSIPASSAPSERSFSLTGFTLNKHRTQLYPETVDDLMFLYSNLSVVNKKP